MGIKHGDGVKIYDGVPLKQWKDKEARRFSIIDDGATFPHSEYGDSYVYHVNRIQEGYDPEKDWTLFIRPNSALYYGALEVLNADKPSLKGRTFDIIKHTGKENRETRYEWKEVFKA